MGIVHAHVALVGLLILVSLMPVSSKVDKYVRIELDTKWKQTPLHFEASEFISERKNSSFWEFVEKIQGKAANTDTDKDVYNAILETASQILTGAELDVLKFSLSIRSYSARVKFFHQIATENRPTCSPFYQSRSGGITCNIDNVLTISNSENLPAVDIQKFDHILPGSEGKQNLIVVYADFMSPDFEAAHKKMLSKVENEDVVYVLRHFYQSGQDSGKVALSGYGVELAVKSTEYKAVDDQKVSEQKRKDDSDKEVDGDEEVDGFLFSKLRELHPQYKDDLEQFKAHLKETNKELAELHVWQLQDLSFQACQRVMSASQQEQIKLLKDLSQNVPMVARSLVKSKVNDDLRSEIKKNQGEFERKNIAPGQTLFQINGIEVPVDEIDAFKLLSILNSETTPMSLLSRLDMENGKSGDLLSLSVKPEQESFIIDTRSENVQWLNDLEKDSQYNYWPSHLQEILRPTFPGMLRYIAKNIFNVVVYLNPMTKVGIQLMQTINELVEHSIPARFGIVFVVGGSPKETIESNVGAGIVRAFSFIKSDRSQADAFKFLTELYHSTNLDVPKADDVRNLFISWFDKSEAKEVLSVDSEYDDLRRVSKIVFDSTGLKALPQILVNGEQLSKEDMENVESSVTHKILAQTNSIQQAVYMGSHQSYPTIYDFVMSQPNVVRRLNSIIQTTEGDYVNFAQYSGDLSNHPEVIHSLKKEEAVGALMNSAKYFIQDKGALTIWVVVDIQSKDGKELLKNTLGYLKKYKNTRVAIVIHGDDSEQINSNDVLQMVIFLRQKLISSVAKLMLKFLDVEEAQLVQLTTKEDLLKELSNGITGINKKKLFELLSSSEALQKVKQIIKTNSLLVKQAYNIKPGDNLVVANGRVLGPLKDEDVFVVDDFELLQSFENNRAGFKISEIIESMKLEKLPSEGHERYRSDLVMKVVSILSQRDDKPRSTLSYRSDEHSVVKVSPRSNSIAYDIVAVLDPLSKGAQKLVPILHVLHDAFNVDLKIFLNPKAKHSELPVKRFYYYVLQPELTFNDKGKLVNDQAAIFTNLPNSALLTLIMDTPQSWLIEAVGSNQDLDNIHLEKADDFVYGDYELEYIIIEGHCSDSQSSQPPRGLQFIAGTHSKPEMFDTIVMANLGYFQLKAFPGSFILQLRGGRSSQIYEIGSLDGGTPLSGNQNYTVLVDSFDGRFLKVNVKRRPGQEKADLLGDGDNEEEDDSIWGSITSYVKTEKSTKSTDGKIHIFSVCTGLLYERFLKIMMMSVLKHTKTPVKFWFLKNYLSAGITKFLPYYADKYGFEYELVQYQWPEWLNGQTEKQRIIWGYKILFLDVLFPLNLERIIFVDADQIVRADLNELMHMDLGGAPYAYTPFCNDRPEVEGFRFWNQGYWRNHLGGRAYHISALYVVDLKRFRRVAAGDRLRGQYQGLSQDPNSLSNLDQDLPNNMIHQVQIKSLPQEWLWCETWCSDESKKNAKTIDMCNNPQTKEPKLERAMRIAPEFSEYDEVIKQLQHTFLAANGTDKVTQSATSASSERVEL